MSRWGALRPAERIAALGAALAAGSLLFPWYGIELELFNGFSQTGLEAFNFAHAALLLTAAAALVLIWLCAGGYVPPRPITEGVLLIAAGAWIGILVAFLAIDRPEEIAGLRPGSPELRRVRGAGRSRGPRARRGAAARCSITGGAEEPWFRPPPAGNLLKCRQAARVGKPPNGARSLTAD